MIFDTCIWIGIASGRLDAKSIIALAGDAPIFVSTISLGELEFGVHSCTEPNERVKRAAFLRRVENRPTLDVTRATALTFGVLAASVKYAGRSPRPHYNDLWIAAQSIENNLTLLTTNTKDFAGLSDLRILNPSVS